MFNLFNNQKPSKAERIYRVENLNPEKGISSAMHVCKDGKFKTILCLAHKTKVTVFPTEELALLEMKKYKAMYKSLS